MKAKVNKVTIQVVRDDILTLSTAALVLDSNTDLLMPPRLAARAGPAVQRELLHHGYCNVGSAVLTSGGDLGFECLIHCVGPRWGEGSERGKLANAIFECLQLAESHRLKSIAFPAISTGANGYPLENCAKTMLTQIIDYTFEELRHLRSIYLCLDDVLAFEVFEREFRLQIDSLREEGDGIVKA